MSKEKQIELKPCKCGCSPYLINRYSNGTRFFAYYCVKCETKVLWLTSVALAKSNWNRRTCNEQS